MTRPADDPGLKLTPYWWEAAPCAEIEPAEVPAAIDVAIVGAGFTGLSAALTLARAGRSVALFDAMRAGEGASSRNGGITSGNVKFPFTVLIEKMGLEIAKAIYGEGVAARDHLARLVTKEGIECNYKLVGRFTGANSAKSYERMGREADSLNKHFGIGVEMVPQAEQHREIGTDFYHGGQFRHDIGGVHPSLLHAGMLACALDAGARVIPKTAVTGIHREAQNFEVATARGATQAGNVIVATNGYTDAALPWLRRRVLPIPSQIIATEPIDLDTMNRLMPRRRVYGDTRNLYNYYRPSPDDTCILFGGRRGANTDDPLKKCAHLYSNLIEIFPELEGIRLTHSWWGYTGYSFDFLPHLMIRDGVHYATAFCGSGVVWAPWLGRKAALTILGDEQGETVFARFAFKGRPLYAGKPWFLPAVIAWYGIKDHFGAARA